MMGQQGLFSAATVDQFSERKYSSVVTAYNTFLAIASNTSLKYRKCRKVQL